MTALEAVVLVFGPEKLTNRQIRERTGIPMRHVAFYLNVLRKRGVIAVVGQGKQMGKGRPFFIYQVIDEAAVAKVAAAPRFDPAYAESPSQKQVEKAGRSQPISVFHLANPMDRMGFEPRDYTERN